ncbi:unnamed protein product [Symbiodinium sp. KB8]|nr:unnamed protein product [Symbiodinium sp. KB8]
MVVAKAGRPLRLAVFSAMICQSADGAYGKQRQRNRLQWKSESSQDQFLVEHLLRNRKGGFFVELGAADGKHFSNTYALEHGMNWLCAENRPASVCVRACAAGREGVRDFIDDEEKPLQSGLSSYTATARSPAARKQMHCMTLPGILKKHGAPSFIDWLSLDVEGAEMEVLEALLSDGSFEIDVMTIEAFAHQAPAKFNFMRTHGYQLLNRLGTDDVYVLGWTAFESHCAEIPGATWLRRKLLQQAGYKEGSLEALLQQLRVSLSVRRMNHTEKTAFERYVYKAEKNRCKAGGFSFSLLKTLLSEDASLIRGLCFGYGLMSQAAVTRLISPEIYDDCSPFYALSWSRMDFILMITSPWPCFLLLQLVSERVSAAFQEIQLCDLYKEGLPEPDSFLNFWPPALAAEAQLCGGLRFALAYLDQAVNSRQKEELWSALEAAERILKLLALKRSILELLSAIGHLPSHRSPWVILSSLQQRWRQAPTSLPRSHMSHCASGSVRESSLQEVRARLHWMSLWQQFAPSTALTGGCQGSSLQTPGARFQFLFLASSWPLPGRFLASSWPLGVFLGSPWVGRLDSHSLSDVASSLAACSRGEGLRALQLGGWDGRDAFSLSFVSVTWFRLTQRHKEDLLQVACPEEMAKANGSAHIDQQEASKINTMLTCLRKKMKAAQEMQNLAETRELLAVIRGETAAKIKPIKDNQTAAAVDMSARDAAHHLVQKEFENDEKALQKIKLTPKAVENFADEVEALATMCKDAAEAAAIRKLQEAALTSINENGKATSVEAAATADGIAENVKEKCHVRTLNLDFFVEHASMLAGAHCGSSFLQDWGGGAATWLGQEGEGPFRLLGPNFKAKAAMALHDDSNRLGHHMVQHLRRHTEHSGKDEHRPSIFLNKTLTSLVHEAAKAPLSDHQLERLHHLDSLHYAELHQDQGRDHHCQEREEMARDQPDHWSLHHEDVNAYMECLCVQRKPSLVCEAIHHEGVLNAADHVVQMMQELSEHFEELNAEGSGQHPPIEWHRGMGQMTSELQTYSNSSQDLGFAIPLGPCDADALSCQVKSFCLSAPFPKAEDDSDAPPTPGDQVCVAGGPLEKLLKLIRRDQEYYPFVGKMGITWSWQPAWMLKAVKLDVSAYWPVHGLVKKYCRWHPATQFPGLKEFSKIDLWPEVSQADKDYFEWYWWWWNQQYGGGGWHQACAEFNYQYPGCHWDHHKAIMACRAYFLEGRRRKPLKKLESLVALGV